MTPAVDYTPTWVYKRDGRLVPFEADKISRSLFAASESLGHPDPFVARELTDSVLHFLTSESSRAPCTTTHVAELVTKIVRELGHPALSQAFAEGGARRPRLAEQATGAPARSNGTPRGPAASAAHHKEPRDRAWHTSAACWRDFALREVFGPELVAAHQQGWIRLGGLATPLELAGQLLRPPPDEYLLEAVEEARKVTGCLLVLDSPEHSLEGSGPLLAPRTWARELSLGVRANALRGIINLNIATPPAWAADIAEGPLFTAADVPLASRERTQRALAFLECFLPRLAPSIRVDWHLGQTDFAEPAEASVRVMQHALEGYPIAFTFDRPRRPVSLAEGIDRLHPTLLTAVAVDLAHLANHLDSRADANHFLDKLRSLTGLALSAGVQKRDFLRRRGPHWPGFLLGQARLVIVPLGLTEVVHRWANGSISHDPGALVFARNVVRRMVEVVQAGARRCSVEACIDLAAAGQFDDLGLDPSCPVREDFTPDPRDQLRAWGALHSDAGGGTVNVVLSHEHWPTNDELVALLHFAWLRTGVTRLQFVQSEAAQTQQVAPWEHGEQV